jgi:hypothetical protein
MSIDAQKVPTVAHKTLPDSLLTRLERWGVPVPAEHADMLPRFLVARQEEAVRMMVPIYIALICLFILFAITDVVFYSSVMLSLLILRGGLIGIHLVGWLILRRLHATRLAYPLSGSVFVLMSVLLCLMFVQSNTPTGFYAMTMLCSIPVMAMLPLPRFWYLLNNGAMIVLYVATMIVAGIIFDPNVIQLVISFVAAATFFAAIHAYADRQRWVSFLNYVRSKDLGARLQGELALAQRIQHGLLQPGRPAWPGLDLVCWSEAAREVGGDFYAYQRIDSDRVGLAVGDVSGKGLPAALLMGTSLAYLRAAVEDATSPGSLLGHLDQVLVGTTRVTRQNCALCCVELSGARLQVANAGGIAPLLRRADARVEWIEAGGLPLGTGLSGLGYNSVWVEVQAGDMLVLVSDGVVEAMDEAGRMFGFERLESTVAACDGASAWVFVAELRDALAGFMGMAEAHDDMTIVALRVGIEAAHPSVV